MQKTIFFVISMIGGIIVFFVTLEQFQAEDVREFKILLLKEQVEACKKATEMVSKANVLSRDGKYESPKLLNDYLSSGIVFLDDDAKKAYKAFIDKAKSCESGNKKDCEKSELVKAQTNLSEKCRFKLDGNWISRISERKSIYEILLCQIGAFCDEP